MPQGQPAASLRLIRHVLQHGKMPYVWGLVCSAGHLPAVCQAVFGSVLAVGLDDPQKTD